MNMKAVFARALLWISSMSIACECLFVFNTQKYKIIMIIIKKNSLAAAAVAALFFHSLFCY